jgi:hypothetical protein
MFLFSGKTRYLMTHLPLVFLFSGKMRYLMSRFAISGRMRYLMTHFATYVLIQWQNEVSYDIFYHGVLIQWQNEVSYESASGILHRHPYMTMKMRNHIFIFRDHGGGE